MRPRNLLFTEFLASIACLCSILVCLLIGAPHLRYWSILLLCMTLAGAVDRRSSRPRLPLAGSDYWAVSTIIVTGFWLVLFVSTWKHGELRGGAVRFAVSAGLSAACVFWFLARYESLLGFMTRLDPILLELARALKASHETERRRRRAAEPARIFGLRWLPRNLVRPDYLELTSRALVYCRRSGLFGVKESLYPLEEISKVDLEQDYALCADLVVYRRGSDTPERMPGFAPRDARRIREAIVRSKGVT